MNCKNCNNPIPQIANFCPYCKTPVKRDKIQAEQVNGQTEMIENTTFSSQGEKQAIDTNTCFDKPVPEKDKEKKADKKKRKKSLPKTEYDDELHGRSNNCPKFGDIVPKLQKMVMSRIASSVLKYTSGMDIEQLRKSLLDNKEEIINVDRISKTLKEIDLNRDRRILKDLIVFEVMIQQEDYTIETNELHTRIKKIEESLLDESNSVDLKEYAKRTNHIFRDLDIYSTVLEAAWRNDDEISADEESLLAELRNRLGLSIKDHRFMEVKLNKFPKKNKELHSRRDIDLFRNELQKEGILFVYKDGKVEKNSIPLEIAKIIRNLFKIELQEINYRRMLSSRIIKNDDLSTVLKEFELSPSGSKEEKIEDIIHSQIKPSSFLDILSNEFLKNLCASTGLKVSGSKEEKIQRIVSFYDDLSFEVSTDTDDREILYHNFELLASRKYQELMAKNVINKQEDVNKSFEKATDYLFEKKFNIEIESGLTGNNPDGKIRRPNNQVILWDNKSCETKVDIKEFLETQFNQYIQKEINKGNNLLYFLVIGPEFTEDSVDCAKLYKFNTNIDIALIEAKVLKSIAEKWSAVNKEEEFPIQLFNKTDLILADEIFSYINKLN